MIVSVKPGADPERVRQGLVARGLWVVRYQTHHGGVHFLARPYSGMVSRESLLSMEGVADIAEPPSPHPMVDAQPKAVEVSGVLIGEGVPPVFMAGPCSIESPEQIDHIAARLSRLGVRFLRGGAFKPRTSPYHFQGLGEQALGWIAAAAKHHNMVAVTEALSEEMVSPVAEHAGMIQIGSRNMQNFPLLHAVGRTGRPVLLKRGMAATIEEWLLAGEHCLFAGAAAVVFCERGIRGFDPGTRHLLDLGAVALMVHGHHQPVVVDPSHALGRKDLIGPLSRAALAAGASGLLLETHDDPAHALSDGPQALSPDEMAALVNDLGQPLPGEAVR